MNLDFQISFKSELLWSTQFCLRPTTLFTPAPGPELAICAQNPAQRAKE